MKTYSKWRTQGIIQSLFKLNINYMVLYRAKVEVVIFEFSFSHNLANYEQYRRLAERGLIASLCK